MTRTLFLIVNTACDIACKYCFYSTGHESRDKRVVELTVLPEVSQRLKHLKFDTVILTGGDPLNRNYRDKTLEIIKILKQHELRVIVNTSGAYLDESFCDRLIAADPSRIDFSVDSYDPSLHNLQRGRFDDTISAIKYLLVKKYTRIVITVVVTAQNQGSILSIFDYFARLGVSDCRFQPAFLPDSFSKFKEVRQPEIDAKLHDDLALVTQFSPDSKVRHLYHQYWFSHYPVSNDVRVVTMAPKPLCHMGKSTFVAEADWSLIPCFHRADIVLGNILEDPLVDLETAINCNQFHSTSLPECVGRHCVSLFSGSQNWILN